MTPWNQNKTGRDQHRMARHQDINRPWNQYNKSHHKRCSKFICKKNTCDLTQMSRDTIRSCDYLKHSDFRRPRGRMCRPMLMLFLYLIMSGNECEAVNPVDEAVHEEEMSNHISPEPCGLLGTLQDAVIQVMTAHYEYGRGIHHLHSLVNQLQIDLSDLKAQLHDLEQTRKQVTITNTNEGKKDHHHKHSNKVVEGEGERKVVEEEIPYPAQIIEGIPGESTGIPDGNREISKQRGRIPETVEIPEAGISQGEITERRAESATDLQNLLADLVPYMEDYFNSSLFINGHETFHGFVNNVSRQFAINGAKIGGLQRRIHGIRKVVKAATNQMEHWEKTLKLYDSRMLSHQLDKQHEINARLERRLVELEMNVKAQEARLQDQPDHKNTADTTTTKGGCPSDFVRHASSCYWFSNVSEHWVDAEKHCQNRHGNAHLIAIETESEHDFIVTYRQYNDARWSSHYLWTGGTNMLDGEGRWRWVGTHLPLTYTRWRTPPHLVTRGQHQQLQECVYFPTLGGDTKWDSWHCYAARLNYVCEIMV